MYAIRLASCIVDSLAHFVSEGVVPARILPSRQFRSFGKQAGMTSLLLSQALCGELSASRLHVIRRPFTSLLHFVPHQLQNVRRDVSSRRCSLCTAAVSSPAAVKAPAAEDTSLHQALQPRDHEWPGLAAWRASGIDDRRHWGPKGPVAQVNLVSHPACSPGRETVSPQATVFGGS